MNDDSNIRLHLSAVNYRIASSIRSDLSRVCYYTWRTAVVLIFAVHELTPLAGQLLSDAANQPEYALAFTTAGPIQCHRCSQQWAQKIWDLRQYFSQISKIKEKGTADTRPRESYSASVDKS
jgi:hypothetical protein